MKYALVDIGSNTIRLNLYQYNGAEIHSLMNKKATAGLSSYVREGYLTDKGIKKLVNVLDKFKNMIDVLDIDKSHIFATAAIRNAENSEDIIKIIKNELDIDMDVLSGEEEAFFGYEGIRQEYSFNTGAIIDIGGGSTEIILVENGEMVFETSLNEGSLSLQTKFVSGILPKKKELEKIKKHVKKVIKNEEIPFNQQYDIYGIGGTIRVCGNVAQEYYDLPSNKEIKTGVLKNLSKKLYDKKNKILRNVLQVNPSRVHTIIPGMVILEELIKSTEADKIYISRNGIREGYLLSIINGQDKKGE